MKSHIEKISEQEIIQLLRAKDREGVSFLYQNYAPILMGIIFKIVKREDVAENILQDTFLKVWQKIEDFNPSKGQFLAWIIGIARNGAIDLIRTKKYQNQLNVYEINDATCGDLKSSSLLNIDHIGIREVIYKLAPKYHQLIELIYFEGYTQVEVAEELNLPLGTVKSRIRKAFSQLKTLLG